MAKHAITMRRLTPLIIYAWAWRRYGRFTGPAMHLSGTNPAAGVCTTEGGCGCAEETLISNDWTIKYDCNMYYIPHQQDYFIQ